MRKNLISAILAGSMLLASSVASAETRPTATRFSQPSAVEHDGARRASPLLLLGGAGLVALVLLLAVGGGNGNSPNR